MYTVCSIWPFVSTLSVASTPGQSDPGINGSEEVLHITQIFRVGASLSDSLIPYPGHLYVGGVSLFCRDAIGIFFSPRRLRSVQTKERSNEKENKQAGKRRKIRVYVTERHGEKRKRLILKMIKNTKKQKKRKEKRKRRKWRKEEKVKCLKLWRRPRFRETEG